MENLESIHRRCRELFEIFLLRGDKERSIGCDIYDAITGNQTDIQNSVGENFNQLIQEIRYSWFGTDVTNMSIEFYARTYLFWLYLFHERVEVILKFASQEDATQLRSEMKVFNEIRLWANFTKHPKEFLFTHWPKYHFTSDNIIFPADAIVVDKDFLINHYSSEKKPRPISLTNKTVVYVSFPDLIVLTSGFCNDFIKFKDFICKNSQLCDDLRNKSNQIYDEG